MRSFEPNPATLITSEMLRQDFIPDAHEALRIIHLDEAETGKDTLIASNHCCGRHCQCGGDCGLVWLYFATPGTPDRAGRLAGIASLELQDHPARSPS